MKFKENVPDGCGGDDSKTCRIDQSADVALTDVWRLLNLDQPTENCFVSYAGLGKKIPKGVCECRACSCSLQLGAEHAAAIMKLQWAKRFTHRARLDIPEGSGKSYESNAHIDFWAYEDFSFLTAVKQVVRK